MLPLKSEKVLDVKNCAIYKQHKPPQRFARCRLDVDTPLSSIATFIPQSPLSSRPHSWLPSLLTLPWLPYTSFPPCFPSLFPYSPPPPSFSLFPYFSYPSYPYNTPILLHYIQLYRLCYPQRRLWRNVRPTPQRRDVHKSCSCFLQPLAAADNDDYLDFRTTTYFFINSFIL